MPHEQYSRGMSLIEVVMGVAIMLIVFAALFGALVGIDTLGRRNELRTSALYLANEHIETIRALPYDSIGTIDGLPYGTIPQLETITHDGHTFVRRTFIQYVDDAADGVGAGDATIPADYKRVKVELSYQIDNATSSFSLVTSMAPKSQESLEGAGILRINVTDANNDPLGNATIDVENFSIATSVDITTFTNASGTVSFPGAWAGAGYNVLVTKGGYSSERTYVASTSNPNPSPSALTVAENSTTEIYFKIDKLSTIDLYTRALPVRGELYDEFTNATMLASTSRTVVLGGTLSLTGAPGSYPSTGTGTSITVAPASLGSWLMFRADASSSTDTNIRYRILHDAGGGVFTPIPNTDLAGNEAGLTRTPIDLRHLDVSTYPALRVEAILESTNPANTPTISSWTLSHLEPEVPRSGVTINMTGAKTIGDDGGTPVYKYDTTHTTDGAGTLSLPNMEFDTYTLEIPGFSVAEACPALPLVLDPDTSHAQTLTLVAPSTHTLALQVLHPTATPIPGAEIVLERAGVETVAATGPCGVGYFSGLTNDTYTATIFAPDLASTTVDISVDGATLHAETLSYW